MAERTLPAEPETISLIYDFRNTRPIELADFTASLFALAEQFKSYIVRREPAHAADDVRLYVKEVRTGSIVAELISFATQNQLLAPAAPLVLEYAQELGEWFEFFKGVKDAVDIKDMLLGTSKKDLQQIATIVEPVAKDGGSIFNIVVQDHGQVVFNAPLSSIEANAGQRRIRRVIDENPMPESGIKEDAVFYWYQVRHDQAKKPGDVGVIESLSMKPVKVRFASDEVKTAMVEMADNPFNKLFVIDVDVTYVGSKPRLYRILTMKDVMDKD